MRFNEDKLIAALKKYNGISKDEFLDMDICQVQAAIEMSGMTKEVAEKIWQKGGADDYVKKALEAAKNGDNRRTNI